MGKKNKDKKGKGKEKTELKTEKKAAKRAKKEIAEKGEVSFVRYIIKHHFTCYLHDHYKHDTHSIGV